MGNNYYVDTLIFGGGIAGLWTLNCLRDKGYSCILIEKEGFGNGQTIASQGIIHGGAKYSLPGDLRLDSTEEIKEMPSRWRKHLKGELKPDLSKVIKSSDFLYMWFSKDHSKLKSKLFDYGKNILRTVPEEISSDKAPEFLRESSSKIYRVNEPVLNISSLLKELAKNYSENIVYSKGKNLEIKFDDDNLIKKIHLGDLTIYPKTVILAAGENNQELANEMGINEIIMQKSPLTQLIVKGDLPEFYAHNIDGLRPNATITTHYQDGETYWNIGGGIAEDFVNLEDARKKLEKILPSINFDNVEFSTVKINKAEPVNEGKRPAGHGIYQNRNVMVVWPTKLALVPILVEDIINKLSEPSDRGQPSFSEDVRVAKYPWINY